MSSSGTHSVGADVNLVDAAYSNGYLYVAARSNGFYSVKVEDGMGLSATHTNNTTYTTTPDARGVAIWGRYLIVADNDGLFVFSLSNPATPTATGNITTISDCYDIDTYGYFAFVASGTRINVVDLSNPVSPSLTDWNPSLGTCTSIAFNAGYAICGYGENGIKVFEFKNYATLKYKSKIKFSVAGATAEGITSIGQQFAVATGDGGGIAFISNAHIFSPDAAYDGEPISMSAYGAGMALDVLVNGKYAYIAVQTYGIITVDLTTNAIVNADEVSGPSALGFAIAGDRLLVVGGATGLYIYNIQNPANPAIDGSPISIGSGIVYDVVTDGKYAYLAMGGSNRGIARVDLFDRSSATLTTPFDVFGIELNGNWLAATCRSDGMGIIDISDFEDGLDESDLDFYTYETGTCHGIYLENDYAYIAYGLGGLRVVKMSDLTSPTGAGLPASTVGRVLGVTRLDSLLLLVRDETNPMVFVDISNPLSPSLVSSSLLPSGSTLPSGVAMWNDHMIVADYFEGLRTWEVYTQKNTLPESQLMSTNINQTGSRALQMSDIKYFNWESQEYFPTDVGDPKDTVTFWVAFSNGTDWDDVKIYRNGIPGLEIYKYPDPLPWGTPVTWEYIGYLTGSTNDLRWKGDIHEQHETWTLDSAWYANYVNIGFTDLPPTGSRRRVSVRLDVDFGGGEITELVIGLDSTATDRYNPGMDELYYPTGPGPHAYFEIDAPDMPDGAGLSTCWVSTNAAGRPIHLVLSHPAEVRWSAPPELDPGVLVIDGTDLTTASSFTLGEGEYLTLPGAGAQVYFRSELSPGWNMVAPMAYPTVNSTADIFGIPVSNIWTYNATSGGYYNTSEVGDGIGYFVLSTSDITNSFHGVIGQWTRTELHPGWNIVGGPTIGAVHISDFITEPAGLIWSGPLYTLDDGSYLASEWFEPGIGYWVYSMGSGVLFAEDDLSVDKAIPTGGTPDAVVNVILSSGNDATELTLGVDPRAEAGKISFDRLLVPPVPGKRNIGGLLADGAPTYLSTVAKATAGEWEIMLFEKCRVGTDSDLLFVRDGEEFAVTTDGTELSAGRYKIYMDGAPVPNRFFMAVSPNPFNAATRIMSYVPRAGDLDISIYDLSGRKVSVVASGDVSTGRHSFTWKATGFDGRELPSGVYFARLSMDKGAPISRKLVLLK